MWELPEPFCLSQYQGGGRGLDRGLHLQEGHQVGQPGGGGLSCPLNWTRPHSTSQADWYTLGILGDGRYPDDSYTISSSNKLWLPAASATGGSAFLMDDPALIASGEAPTITLAALKAEISRDRGRCRRRHGGLQEMRVAEVRMGEKGAIRIRCQLPPDSSTHRGEIRSGSPRDGAI